MNIGFVSVWGERGAAYVTKSYIKLLEEKHSVFVYSRGYHKANKNLENSWNESNVTEGLWLEGTKINWRHFKKWVKTNKIDTLFFNEQREIEILAKIKKSFPNIKLGSYIDYYKEHTVESFGIYDFLICNTKRHYSVFSWHPNCFYVPWGTDISLFTPTYSREDNLELTFFHSAGMSNRKGTSLLYKTFVNGKLYEKCKLVIHTQQPVESYGFNKEEALKFNIEVIEKSVSAPGLYKLGDVYVYPTMLDGLGLTIYEALASGLPVITSNEAPMNEIINNEVGKLVDIELKRSRWDAYYWPVVQCEEYSLLSKMEYYIENQVKIKEFKKSAREYAEKNLNWNDREKIINDIFTGNYIQTSYNPTDSEKLKSKIIMYLINKSPDIIVDILNKKIIEK